MTQDELKQLVGRAAADYVRAHVPEGGIVGVGTGSTANCFIDALALDKARYAGAVSSSEATTQRLLQHGITVFDLNEVEALSVYVDGADEINHAGHMIKGGGGALTREKIVASVAREFVCIADASKQVELLGRFPLPIEVVPMAQAAIGRQVVALGGTPVLRLRADGTPVLRLRADGTPYLTDNGNRILDVQGLQIADACALETQVNNWPGVVTVGLFAVRGADLCLLGSAHGVARINYPGA